jgi:hypothetical protein
VKPKVYIETSVLSYLTAMPSRDIVVAAHQQITIEWWARRDGFSLYGSEAVLAEARHGDPMAAARRLAAAEELELVSAIPAAQELAQALVDAAAIPAKAAMDAVHVALATVHGLDFLMTWNCAHIANATMRPKIEAVCRAAGLRPPIICTPEELVEEEVE